MRWTFLFLGLLAGCGSEGVAGDPCETDDDCGDDLHCHIEDGAGECDAEHEDHDHDDDMEM